MNTIYTEPTLQGDQSTILKDSWDDTPITKSKIGIVTLYIEGKMARR